MKYIALVFLLFSAKFINAQILAGVVPPGAQAVLVNDTLATPYLPAVQDSVAFDIDCDNVIDFKLYLDSGDPWMDVPHHLIVSYVDTNVHLCMLDSLWIVPQSFVPWYSSNDTIGCPNGYTWNNNFFGSYYHWIAESNVFIGNYNPPSKLDNKYFAFKKILPNNQEYLGWVELSFKLDSVGYPWAVVHQFTEFCTPESTKDLTTASNFKVYPTLFQDVITIKSNKAEDYKVSLLSVSGQLLDQRNISGQEEHQLESSMLASGIYILSIEWSGGMEVHKILKQ